MKRTYLPIASALNLFAALMLVAASFGPVPAASQSQTTSPEASLSTTTSSIRVFLPVLDSPACQPQIYGQLSADEQKEAQVLDGLNQQRIANSLPALQPSAELAQAARYHSLDMAVNNFQSHSGSNGLQPADRISQSCYPWWYWGEIIGWGFNGEVNRMIEWWMNSPEHREIILLNVFTEFGAGYEVNEQGSRSQYYTVDFGSRPPSEGISSIVTSLARVQSYTCSFASSGPEGGALVTIHSPSPCQGRFSPVK